MFVCARLLFRHRLAHMLMLAPYTIWPQNIHCVNVSASTPLTLFGDTIARARLTKLTVLAAMVYTCFYL